MKPLLILTATCGLLFSVTSLAQDGRSSDATAKGKDPAQATPTKPATQKRGASGEGGGSVEQEDSGGFDAFGGGGEGGFGGGGFGTYENFSGGAGAFGGGQVPQSMQRMVSSGQIIITWSEKKDELRGFSIERGKWSILKIDPQKTLVPVVGDTVAAVKLKDGMAAFSGAASRWHILKLPKDSKAPPIISNGLVTVHEDDHIYTFAASTGKWTSPTDSSLREINVTSRLSAQADRGKIHQTAKESNVAVQTTNDTIVVRGAEKDVKNFFAQFKAKPTSTETANAFEMESSDPFGSPVTTSPGNQLPPVALPLGGQSPLSSRSQSPAVPKSIRNAPSLFPGPSSQSGLPLPGLTTGSKPGSLNRFTFPGTTGLTRTSKTEQASLDLAKKLKGKDVSDKDRTELRKLVSAALDERLKTQQKSVDELRKKLESVESKLKTRKDNRKRIIDRRIEELLNPDLDWNSVASKGNVFPSRPSFAVTSGAKPFDAPRFFSPAPGVTTSGKETSPNRFTPGSGPNLKLTAPKSGSPSLPHFLDRKSSSANSPSREPGSDPGVWSRRLQEARTKHRSVLLNMAMVRSDRSNSEDRLLALERAEKTLRSDSDPERQHKLAEETDKLENSLLKLDSHAKSLKQQESSALADWKQARKELQRALDLQIRRVAAAQADVDVKKATVERSKALFDRNVASKSDVDKARIAFVMSELSLREAESVLETLHDLLNKRPDLKPPAKSILADSDAEKELKKEEKEKEQKN